MKNIQEIFYDEKECPKAFRNEDKFPRIKLIRKYLNLSIKKDKKRSKILDIGCANGEMCKDFTEKANIYGIDISKILLKKAEKNGYKTIQLDLEKSRLPFKDSDFDVVVSGELIEHIVNTDWLMAEINRVLKKRGKLIVSVPNVNQWIGYIMMAIFDLPPRFSARFRSLHVRDFTFKTFKACLKEFGFKTTLCSGTGLFIPLVNRNFFTSLTKIFPRFGSEIVFLSQKEKRVPYQEEKAVKIK